MRRGGPAGLALLLPALLLVSAAPLPVHSIAVPAGGQPYLNLRIKRADVRARLALSYDQALILNSGPAGRAGLKAFPLLGKQTFKNAMIPGGIATFRFNLYDITPQGLPEVGVPAVWVDKPIAADADGVLSITALKAERLVFDLGPPGPGSLTYTLTRPDRGSVMMRAVIGDEKIDIAFELNAADTVMNARAAAALVAAGLVKRNGRVGLWQPFPNVALPFERLTPAPGATLVGLPLIAPGVRITEGEARRLDAAARAGTSTAADDADAITVTADRKKGRDPWILIGRDVLSHCSRIAFDRPAKVWQLTCAF